jgi:hypothetical protein
MRVGNRIARSAGEAAKLPPPREKTRASKVAKANKKDTTEAKTITADQKPIAARMRQRDRKIEIVSLDAALATPRRRTQKIKPLTPYMLKVAEAVLRGTDEVKEENFAAAYWEYLCNQAGALLDSAHVYVALKRLEKRNVITGSVALHPSGADYKVTAYIVTDAGREDIKISREFYSNL